MAGKPPPEKQCTAGSKRRPGERCEAWAMGGKKTCYHHGGASPIGAGSPHFKDGTRSKAGAIFSGDALEHYEAARRDERYLELREDIAVLDTLIVEALKAARVGEGGVLWAELGEAWRRYQEAGPNDTDAAARRALRRIGALITEGAGREAAEARALEIFESKRKFSETERKRILDQERTITQVQAMSFVAAMVALMREAVAGEENEREILARFHAGVARLVQRYVSASAGGPEDSVPWELREEA
jgi:hypothetical protein